MSSLAPLLSSERQSWETPEMFLQLVRQLGPIDLDPCANKDNPCDAKIFLTREALEADWRRLLHSKPGLAYCNPPYGREIGDWVYKCVQESFRGVEIVLLTPARPDTEWYDRARRSCQAWCEIKGRLTFKGAKNPAPFPSAVHYWGPRPHLFAHIFSELGRVGVRS